MGNVELPLEQLLDMTVPKHEITLKQNQRIGLAKRISLDENLEKQTFFHHSIDREKLHEMLSKMWIPKIDNDGLGDYAKRNRTKERIIKFPFIDSQEELFSAYTVKNKKLNGYRFEAKWRVLNGDYSLGISHVDFNDFYPIVTIRFDSGYDFLRLAGIWGMHSTQVEKLKSPEREIAEHFLESVDFPSLAIELVTQIAKYARVPEVQVLPAKENYLPSYDLKCKDAPEVTQKEYLKATLDKPAKELGFNPPTAEKPVFYKNLKKQFK